VNRNFQTKYRPDIDGLRAVAVLSVVIYHAAPQLLPGGFIGVDIFFVISGYLISNIILKSADGEGFSFLGFYGNRIRRIFPAFIVVLLACYLAGWVYLTPAEFKSLGAQMMSSAAFYQNIYLLRSSGYFDAGSEVKTSSSSLVAWGRGTVLLALSCTAFGLNQGKAK
jgi:peptidoglycan/LPS O-acetylase OafA/YrhL